MSMRSLLFKSGTTDDDKDHELSELKNKHSSLLKAFNEGKVEYERAIASKAEDKEEIATLRQNASSLEGRIAVLEKELQACRDDLFRLQPMDQVPDSTIAQRFESLDDQIRDWIDTETSRFMDKWEPRSPEEQPKLFHDNGEVLTRNFLAEYSDKVGEYIVRHMLHTFLDQTLFGEKMLLFGLESSSVALLESIEDGMTELDPPREHATIQAWRSEALTSLARSSTFSAQLSKAKRRLNMNVFEALGAHFPIIRGNQISFNSLCEKVMTPAVELAITIQTCATSYRFNPEMSTTPMFQHGRVTKNHLRSLRVVDVATGKTLKPDSPIIIDENGYIGKILMVLKPGLFRHDTDRQIPLSQQVILIQLHTPLGRRRAQTVEPT